MLFGLIRGWKNGLFVEIASVIAVIVAFYGAMQFSYLIGDYLSGKLRWDAGCIKIASVG